MSWSQPVGRAESWRLNGTVRWDTTDAAPRQPSLPRTTRLIASGHVPQPKNNGGVGNGQWIAQTPQQPVSGFCLRRCSSADGSPKSEGQESCASAAPHKQVKPQTAEVHQTSARPTPHHEWEAAALAETGTRKLKAADVRSSTDKWIAGMKSGPGTGDVGRDRVWHQMGESIQTSKTRMNWRGLTDHNGWTGFLVTRQRTSPLCMSFIHCVFRALKRRGGTNLDNDANNEDGPLRREGSSRGL